MSIESHPDEKTVLRAAPTGPEDRPSAGSDEAEEMWESTVRKDVMVGQRIDEFGDAILVGGANEVYVAGTTTSANLRGRLADGGVGDSLQGGSDGFVARLTPSGAALEWLLHIVGGSDDTVNKRVSNGAGKLFAVGETLSGDLSKVAGAPMTLPVVDWEGFVACIDINEPRTDWFIVHQATGDESVLDVAYRDEVDGLVYFTGGTRP